MKIFTLLAVFALLTCSVSAQTYIGRQLVDQYPITSFRQMTYGLTWLPAEYNSTQKKYPLIIFLHGAGECGDGVQGLNNLITQALPKKIADGWDPEAVNSSDGQSYKFIVISPQAPKSSNWSYTYTHVRYILADVLSRYRIDESRIYISGASAGGGGTWSSVTTDSNFTKKIAAIVPVSSTPVNNPSVENNNIPFISGKYGVKVWTVCGTNDSRYKMAEDYVKRINNGKPNPVVKAAVTGLMGLGHSYTAFSTAYDPLWKNNIFNQNIYEWMLRYSRSGNPVTVNQAPIANAGNDKSITLPVNSVTLSGTGSDADGSIASYYWTKISGPAQFSMDNTNMPTVNISNLTQGTYVFQLQVTDNYGATGIEDVTIIVNPAVTPSTNNVIPGMIESENYSAMSGLLKQTTSDVSGGLNVGWLDNQDWLEYEVEVLSAGTYTVSCRVASPNNGSILQLKDQNGAELCRLDVTNTGDWQNWITITSTPISLNAGIQKLRVYMLNGRFNSNWMEFIESDPTISNRILETNQQNVQITPFQAGSSSTVSNQLNQQQSTSPIKVYPNPVTDRFTLAINTTDKGTARIIIRNSMGAIQKQSQVQKLNSAPFIINMSTAGLVAGRYSLEVHLGNKMHALSIVKIE